MFRFSARFDAREYLCELDDEATAKNLVDSGGKIKAPKFKEWEPDAFLLIEDGAWLNNLTVDKDYLNDVGHRGIHAKARRRQERRAVRRQRAQRALLRPLHAHMPSKELCERVRRSLNQLLRP